MWFIIGFILGLLSGLIVCSVAMVGGRYDEQD
jgi:hypothetical protein